MSCKYEFQFAQMEIKETYAVFTANEGINLDHKEIKEVWAVLKENYCEKNFGFIANRINSYSTNPLAIRDFFLHENIVAGAIVSKTEEGKSIADYERIIIIEAQIQNFRDIEPAIAWMNEVFS